MKYQYDLSIIKSKVSIRDLLKHHGIEMPDNKRMICSPLRNEKTPSFSISEDNRMFYDFGSSLGGTVIDLQVHLTGSDIGTAIASLAAMAGCPMEERDIDGSPLTRIPPPPLRQLIDERSPLLSLEKARSLRVNLKHFLSDPYRNEAKRTLMWIPEDKLRDVLRRGWLGAEHGGKLAYLFRRGWKERTIADSSRGDRWRSGKAKDNAFVSYLDDEDITNPEKTTLLFCEGESDSMAATILFGDHCKIFGCLSCQHTPPMDLLYPFMRGCDRAVILFDGDKAGEDGARKLRSFLQSKFPETSIQIFDMPDGKDVKKLFVEENTSALNDFVLGIPANQADL